MAGMVFNLRDAARKSLMFKDLEEAKRAQENGRALLQEREDCPKEYRCPDILWQGIFRTVADHLKQYTWEVWLGTAVALGAIAQRNIHTKYYGDLFAPFFGLIVNPTGTGKSLCTNTCRALLPEWYTWRGGVQSGPGLAPILAVVDRDKYGKVLSTNSRPACLIVSEWSVLARNLKIQHSTLMEDLNVIFDGTPRWNVTRSDRSGGGDLVIENPTLSICGTTTLSLFCEEVTPRMMQSGFVNRYLVLPGQRKKWKFYDPQGASMDFAGLERFSQESQSLDSFGQGQTVWDLYLPEAREALLAWGEPLFEERLMADESAEAQAFKRLHTYAHKIALLYAWSSRAQRISLAHVEAMKVVIDTSTQFLRELLATDTIEVPAHVRYETTAKEKIAEKVKRESGAVDLRKLSQDFRRSMKSADIKRWTAELQAEKRIEKVGKRWFNYLND